VTKNACARPLEIKHPSATNSIKMGCSGPLEIKKWVTI